MQSQHIEPEEGTKPEISRIDWNYPMQKYESLKKAGYAVTEKEFAGDNNWMITCRDPNGIFIELQQYIDKSMQLVGGICEVDYEP